MAICEICACEVSSVEGCKVDKLFIDGKLYKRIPVTGQTLRSRCVDCGAVFGTYHHWECDQEMCPACNKQLLFCDCEDIGVEEE